MHQIWRGREEREKKKRNQRAKKREKRNKGRVSERQRAGIFFFSFLSFFFHFRSLILLSFQRNDQKLKSFRVLAPWQYCLLSFFEAAVVSRPATRPNALFFDQENCHVLCPSRKEESNFLAFLTPSFQSLDKPAQPSHKRPFSQPSPSFFSVFVLFFFLRKKLRYFILLCHRVSAQNKTISS